MAKKNKRFAVAYEESGVVNGTMILVDKETGVHYLFFHSGNAGGLTPLLDREGKPVITTVFEGLE